MVTAIVIGFITAKSWFGNYDERRRTGKRSVSCPLWVLCEEACKTQNAAQQRFGCAHKHFNNFRLSVFHQ